MRRANTSDDPSPVAGKDPVVAPVPAAVVHLGKLEGARGHARRWPESLDVPDVTDPAGTVTAWPEGDDGADLGRVALGVSHPGSAAEPLVGVAEPRDAPPAGNVPGALPVGEMVAAGGAGPWRCIAPGELLINLGDLHADGSRRRACRLQTGVAHPDEHEQGVAVRRQLTFERRRRRGVLVDLPLLAGDGAFLGADVALQMLDLFGDVRGAREPVHGLAEGGGAEHRRHP